MTPEAKEQPPQIAGRYALGQPIGRGGMATVYEAQDAQLGRRVAVKVLDVPDHLPSGDVEALVKRMHREARAIGGLSHPNIVTVLDTGEREGVPFLVMEYLDGRTLRQRLDGEGPLPPAEVAAIVSQVARGLDAVHRQGLLHRDIKPSNIMLLPGGSGAPHVKLMDFGIARRSDDTMLTRTGMMVGSPAYMAPETIRGEEPTPAADIWALGALLYEMLAGRPPFEAPAIATVFYQIMNQAPAPLAGADPAVRRVLNRALEKNPARRFASAGALAEAFSRAVGAEAVPPRPRTPRKARRRPAAVAIGALVGVMSLLALVLLGSRAFFSRGAAGNAPVAPLTPPPPPAPVPPRAATVPTAPPAPRPGPKQAAPTRTVAPAPKTGIARKPLPPQPKQPQKPAVAATGRSPARRAPAKKAAKAPPARRTPRRVQQAPPVRRVRQDARTRAPVRPAQRRQTRTQGPSLLERKIRLATALVRLKKEARRVNQRDPAAVAAYNRKVYALRRRQQQFNADVRRSRGGAG